MKPDAKLTVKLTPVKAKMALRFETTDVNLALIFIYSIYSIYFTYLIGNIWEPEWKYRILSLSKKHNFNKRWISWVKVSEFHHTQ